MGALRDFVSDVLEMEGSAVEAVEPDGLEVLAPDPLRTAIGAWHCTQNVPSAPFVSRCARWFIARKIGSSDA